LSQFNPYVFLHRNAVYTTIRATCPAHFVPVDFTDHPNSKLRKMQLKLFVVRIASSFPGTLF
jgi:hypothetical protein